MGNIVDRRQSGSGKSAPNRQKFIQRAKRHLKRSVDDIVNKGRLKDAGKDTEVPINPDALDEPSFEYDRKEGIRDYVNTGNKEYEKGDQIVKPRGSGQGRGGEGQDEFLFQLTKEEFLEIYFSDMELPAFIKESLTGSDKYKLSKAGYSKDGIPPRLNIKKTMEQAIARRISTKAQGKKPRFLDDEDIKYDYYEQKPYPIKKAVVFFVMDVSGSMGKFEKDIAKRFMLLFYLFLEREYDNVEVRFIRYHSYAREVDEDEFFYGIDNGGTETSKAFILMDEIISQEIDTATTNIYVAQCSDGDNLEDDNNVALIQVLRDKILPKVQYFAYIEIASQESIVIGTLYGIVKLFKIYRQLADKFKHFQQRYVSSRTQVFPVFAELFKKKLGGK